MKKILTLIALFAAAVTAFAMTDAERYAKIKTLAANSKEPAKLAILATYDALINANPANFTTIQEKFTEIYAKFNLSAKERDIQLCGFTLWNYEQRFLEESYALAKAQNFPTAFWAVYYYKTKLGIEEKEEFEMLAKGMLHKTVPLRIKHVVCDRILEMAPGLDAKLVKETLTTINRTLTPYLLTEQKGQYENMVAKIRTMLGAY